MLRTVKFQEMPLKLINNSFSNNKLPHSLLFEGPSGSGKTAIALYLAAKIFCSSNEKPCFICDNCKKVNNLSHSGLVIINTDRIGETISSINEIIKQHGVNDDLINELNNVLRDLKYRIEAGFLKIKGLSSAKNKKLFQKSKEIIDEYLSLSENEKQYYKDFNGLIEKSLFITEKINTNNIPVDSIRKVMNRLYKSNFSGHTVVIITGIEKMRAEGANAFLKTLEEPPENTTIILCTDQSDKVLSTIKSRCFIIPFKELTNEMVKEIALTNWKINIDINDIANKGLLFVRLNSINKNNVKHFVENILPNFERNIMAFIDKIVEQDKVVDFLHELLELFSDSSSIEYNFKGMFIKEINSFCKFVNEAYKYVVFNNADKKMALEAILMRLHSLWRRRLT